MKQAGKRQKVQNRDKKMRIMKMIMMMRMMKIIKMIIGAQRKTSILKQTIWRHLREHVADE